MIYAHIYNSKLSVSDRCLEIRFCTPLLMALLQYGQLNALLLLCRSAHCTEQTPREATLCRESQTSHSRVYPKKSLGLSDYIFYLKKAANRVWKLLNSAKVALVCVWDVELMTAGGGYLWRSMWILWMSSSVCHHVLLVLQLQFLNFHA